MLLLSNETGQYPFPTSTPSGTENPIYFPTSPRLLGASLAASETLPLSPIQYRNETLFPKYVTGTLASTDAFDTRYPVNSALSAQLHIAAFGMEAAAVAQTVFQWDAAVEFMVVKAISNVVDSGGQEQYHELLQATADEAAQVTLATIKQLSVSSEQ